MKNKHVFTTLKFLDMTNNIVRDCVGFLFLNAYYIIILNT